MKVDGKKQILPYIAVSTGSSVYGLRYPSSTGMNGRGPYELSILFINLPVPTYGWRRPHGTPLGLNDSIFLSRKRVTAGKSELLCGPEAKERKDGTSDSDKLS